MASIEVDFEVFKELTSRRTSESDSCNDVIRRALGIRTTPVRQNAKAATGVTFKEVFFPDGTQFRGTYKGRTYTAEIKGGAWIGNDGATRNSPSEAAVKITGKSWNGWIFWHCKRPGDAGWQLIDALRPSSKAKLAALA
jgi:hypothetical protein